MKFVLKKLVQMNAGGGGGGQERAEENALMGAGRRLRFASKTTQIVGFRVGYSRKVVDSDSAWKTHRKT